jgi:lipopolysaccharide export system permease protein
MRITILHRYLLRNFFYSFLGCLLAFVTLFTVFDFFERLKTFIKEGSTVFQAVTYILLKIPLIVHLMTPVAVLVATLLAVGRLSQLSEITAMRASGASINWLILPLIVAGLFISVLQFAAGETLVPWATQAVSELYHLDIKKKVEKGGLSRENFWFRKDNSFYSVDSYDSSTAKINGVTRLDFDRQFRLKKRVDSESAEWVSGRVGWTAKNTSEIEFENGNKVKLESFKILPLVLSEKPSDFYNMQRGPEEMTSTELRNYIDKLRSEGVPVIKYLVNLSAKFSFPLVNAIAIMLAFPFALQSARSGKLTKGFITGIGIGFAYHFVHAVSSSLGSAELIPVTAAAWGANIIFACVGIFLVAGAEY